MLTNQRIQKTIEEIRDISQIEIALVSPLGKLIASTENLGQSTINEVREFINSNEIELVKDGYTFYKIILGDDVEQVLVMYTDKSQDEILVRMAASQIRTLIKASAQKYDRTNFIQNILLGNMHNVDMQSKARKLHIEEKARVAFVIDTGSKGNDEAIELVKNLSNMKSGDFVTTVDNHSIVLVKDVSHVLEQELDEKLEEIAMSLVDCIHMEVMIKVRVAFGNVIHTIEEIAESFKQAKLALEVGRVFYAEKDTISYGKLGLGRLIYQLPIDLCEMFIEEVFGGKVPDILEDEEAMSTVNMFFDNNLNISETARQLYVHRNTLVYRLERIEKAIGLDIRTFDDAMTFRIAVMVLAHIRNSKEY